MGAQATPTAAIVVIGSEILSGRTRDENGPWLAARLAALGVPVAEIRVVPDTGAGIGAAVNHLRAAHDYVISTGGIGPTHDDVTSAAVAAAFGLPLALHPDARELLVRKYGEALNEARLRMARIPEGAELIENPVSAAPGFRIANVFVLAGVPEIMRAMFESVRHLIGGGPPVRSRAVTADLSEGDLAGDLAAVQSRFADVQIGSYPFFSSRRIGCSIVVRSTDADRMDAAAREITEMIRAHGGYPVDGDLAAGTG